MAVRRVLVLLHSAYQRGDANDRGPPPWPAGARVTSSRRWEPHSPPGIRSSFTRASFGTASNTGIAFTSTFPSGRIVVSDRMSIPTDRSDPSRVDQLTSPTRGALAFRAASPRAGLAGVPTPP